MPDFRRLHPRLTETDLDTTPFLPELTPVVDSRGDPLMTRPWLDWARRLTLLVQIKTGGGGGDNPDHVVGPDGAGPDDIAIYNGNTGKIIKDSLKSIGSVINDAVNQAIAAILPGGKLPLTNLPLHHLTHQTGGNDVVDVKALGGYPGGTTAFLRADQTFAVPPGGSAGGMNLDYLGDYVAGPVYNDGDIVIAADQVAYMCVVDGTTTPPEPWPGVGVAVNATVDATYWTVTPHASLVNERALNGLGTGYVRSAVGEPSVVPTIPLTDTTGILPDNRLTSNVALKNTNNNFVAQTIATGTTISGPNSIFYLHNSSANINQKYWRFISYGPGNPNLYVEALNDTQGAIQAQFAFGGDNQMYGGGGGLTNLNAAQLATGIAPPARLGTGTANATTFLRGDSTWAIPDSFPSGLIVISVTPCPVGWTRVAWDGYMIRGSATPGGVVGSDTHAHGVGSYSIPGHAHPTATTTMSVEHAHGFGIHAYFDSGNDSAGLLNVDGGSSGNMSRGPHNHRTQIDYDGATGNGGAHDHTVGIPAVGAIGLQGGSDAASNVPLSVGVFFCQKN